MRRLSSASCFVPVGRSHRATVSTEGENVPLKDNEDMELTFVENPEQRRIECGWAFGSWSYTIGLGLHSLEADQEPGSQMIEAHLSIQHPEYNKPSFANDLMLIKLEESVPSSDTIQDISIASQCPGAGGDSCLVSGWGRLVNGRLPKVLQCVNISVVSEKICSELYAHVYHPSMFCAGGGQDQKDSCHGDSGGPLVCNGSLQGLVSFGQAQCGQPYVPSVYTNLCKFTDWIQKTIQAS
ncbi:hypothetical protein MG293_015726 [Ovis ammon polii]|uniref:Peptidase S1 domain-containing protein n=1 Tax=Ovis ammon polii TaxID=230172 RepID=A0AAD4Y658_OVIAM|nr:hypothetical protein MG293_015726 [Ovis ammon polii]